MIRLSDGTLLALTKLRTRKVRTVVTVVTASLLFGGLVAAVLVIGGVVQSATSFTKGSLSDRYITNVQYFGDSSYDSSSPVLLARATELYTQLVADKKAEAKRLGVEYDPAMEQKPVIKEASGETYLDGSSPTAQKAIAEYQATQETDFQRVQKLAAPYHPLKTYSMRASSMPGTMTVMKNGVEDFTMPNTASDGYMGSQDVSTGWSYLDESLSAPFLLSHAQLASQKNIEDLPVIAPFSKVEAALNLPALPKNASATERMERIATIRDKAASVTFTACYRNSVSAMQISEARRVADDIKKHKGDATYQQPQLQYGLPATDSCAGAPVVRDVRSSADRQQADKELQFNRAFDEVVDPVQQKVTFRVVGIGPDGFTEESFSAIGLLVSAVAGSSLQGQWVVPQHLYDAMPSKATYVAFEPSATTALQYMNVGQGGQLVEFATASDAKTFVAKVGCTGMDCGGGKPYISYFGSNSVLLDDIIKCVTKGLAITVLIVASIAALIMMGMIGRVIGDSRRETAVFRAIGAKRNDIRAIYVIYTTLLSSLVAAAALLIGTGVALWVDSKWSAGATAQAQVTFIGARGTEQFHLIGLWWQALALLVVVVIATGLVSMLLPLSRNLARSPIKDMRDDT